IPKCLARPPTTPAIMRFDRDRRNGPLRSDTGYLREGGAALRLQVRPRARSVRCRRGRREIDGSDPQDDRINVDVIQVHKDDNREFVVYEPCDVAAGAWHSARVVDEFVARTVASIQPNPVRSGPAVVQRDGSPHLAAS